MIDRDILIYVLAAAIVAFCFLADCLWSSLKGRRGTWKS
jgi:hypothetical protein